MLILKSGLIFYKNTNDILISPNSSRMKRITSPAIDEIWQEMKAVECNYEQNNNKVTQMLMDNNLVFPVDEHECELYELYARNIHSLANLHEDPFIKFKNIIGKKSIGYRRWNCWCSFTQIVE